MKDTVVLCDSFNCGICELEFDKESGLYKIKEGEKPLFSLDDNLHVEVEHYDD